jgi:hypothetical protein
MINISEFTDFRKFLRDYASEKKKQHPDWSLAVWARELGLSSTSSLTKILNGQREAGDKFCFKVIEYFQFSVEQAKHFDYLVFQSKIKPKNQEPSPKLPARREHVDLTLAVPPEKFTAIDSLIQKLAAELHALAQEHPLESLRGQDFHRLSIKIWSHLKKA